MDGPRLHSIVKMARGISPGVLVVIEDNPHKPVNRFTGAPLTGACTRYIFPADKVAYVLGEVDPAALARLLEDGKPQAPTVNGRATHAFWATNMARKGGADAEGWTVLAGAKVGDMLRVRFRGLVRNAELVRVMERGTRYNLVVKVDGKPWKIQVGAVVAPPKENDAAQR
jgi:hypothetical protein